MMIGKNQALGMPSAIPMRPPLGLSSAQMSRYKTRLGHNGGTLRAAPVDAGANARRDVNLIADEAPLDSLPGSSRTIQPQ